MWIRTSEPCHALTYMRAKLSFSIAILLRQYMMELLNCHLLSFTLILDSLGASNLVRDENVMFCLKNEIFIRILLK